MIAARGVLEKPVLVNPKLTDAWRASRSIKFEFWRQAPEIYFSIATLGDTRDRVNAPHLSTSTNSRLPCRTAWDIRTSLRRPIGPKAIFVLGIRACRTWRGRVWPGAPVPAYPRPAPPAILLFNVLASIDA